MAMPKKRRGWRTIHIDGHEYHWRFDGTLDVLATPQGQRLRVWWPQAEERPFLVTAPSEPFVITPAFVRQTVLFALHSNWNPSLKGGIFAVEYKHPDFSVIVAGAAHYSSSYPT
jgi:hypothetical protein